MAEYNREQRNKPSRAIANQKTVKLASQLMRDGAKGDYAKDRRSLATILGIVDKRHPTHGANYDPVPKFNKLSEEDGLMFIAKNLIEPTQKTDEEAKDAVKQL